MAGPALRPFLCPLNLPRLVSSPEAGWCSGEDVAGLLPDMVLSGAGWTRAFCRSLRGSLTE